VLAVVSWEAVKGWPGCPDELTALQVELERMRPPPWRPSGDLRVGGVFVCFPRGPTGPGRAGDAAWAAAATVGERGVEGPVVVPGTAPAPYEAGLLALREGPILESAVRALRRLPDVLLVDATGRDHARRAGLALHLGAVLGLPTVGVTHRPLAASGEWPPDERAARSPLELGGEVVGCWLRTRRGARPLAVHAAWRTDADTAAEVVLRSLGRARTPEPLRIARRAARTARAAA
jgi:deoxyribonuclease V